MSSARKWVRNAFVTLLLCALTGAALAADPAGVRLRLATTTSTDNSGLLDALLPPFSEKWGYEIHVIAVGTGKALRLLANGDVDVAMTHARDLELELLRDSYAESRHQFMYNDFIIVGPPSDPAGVSDSIGVDAAMRAIERSEAIFLSRGDNSGTHVREQTLWTEAGIEPQGDWYRATGQGMGRTLQMATELDAYTLTDRGTWLSYRKHSSLVPLFQGDERLFNIYSVLPANRDRYPDLNHAGAQALLEWLLSPPAKAIIRNFRIDGEHLFIPLLEQ